MELSALELGGIYQADWDKRPFRIIGLDEHEVFYDCEWSEGQWTFSGRFKRTCIFYRVPTALFAKRSQRIGDLPFTPEELNAFRPDLPMRIGRSQNLSWNKPWDMDVTVLTGTDQRIATDTVVLVPYGPKGGLKSGVVVKSAGGELRVVDLMLQAKRIQTTANAEPSKGIGLYRLGWQKRLPSYYIGEYHDCAGHVR